jgi:hypothetical protein
LQAVPHLEKEGPATVEDAPATVEDAPATVEDAPRRADFQPRRADFQPGEVKRPLEKSSFTNRSLETAGEVASSGDLDYISEKRRFNVNNSFWKTGNFPYIELSFLYPVVFRSSLLLIRQPGRIVVSIIWLKLWLE